MKNYNILGFPRSGNHWISYIINYFFGRDITDQTIITNHHFFPDDNKPLIYIIRNPIECIIRHFSLNAVLNYPNIIFFMESGLNKDGYVPSLFMENLEKFDAFKHEKILVYYEDLILNKLEEIEKIGNFIGASKIQVNSFIDNYEDHRQKSLDWYISPKRSIIKDVSMTRGLDMKFHSKQLSSKQINEFENYFLYNNRKLFFKYLKRYY